MQRTLQVLSNLYIVFESQRSRKKRKKKITYESTVLYPPLWQTVTFAFRRENVRNSSAFLAGVQRLAPQVSHPDAVTLGKFWHKARVVRFRK